MFGLCPVRPGSESYDTTWMFYMEEFGAQPLWFTPYSELDGHFKIVDSVTGESLAEGNYELSNEHSASFWQFDGDDEVTVFYPQAMFGWD
jgi:hypothetical protein